MQRIARTGSRHRQGVFDKLDQPIPLGYSCTGKAIAVGRRRDRRRGRRPGGLRGRKGREPRRGEPRPPEPLRAGSRRRERRGGGVRHRRGHRAPGRSHAAPTLGETVAVIGLGLIGQIAVQLLKANGCGSWARPRRGEGGAGREAGRGPRGRRPGDVAGACAGLTVAAAPTASSSAQRPSRTTRWSWPATSAATAGASSWWAPWAWTSRAAPTTTRSCPSASRDPTGQAGTTRVRGRGVDYPIGHVRWTERRNMEAFLELCATGALRMEPLVTHRFPFERAEEAYATVAGGGDPLGVLLEYAAWAAPPRTVSLKPPRGGGCARGHARRGRQLRHRRPRAGHREVPGRPAGQRGLGARDVGPSPGDEVRLREVLHRRGRCPVGAGIERRLRGHAPRPPRRAGTEGAPRRQEPVPGEAGRARRGGAGSAPRGVARVGRIFTVGSTGASLPSRSR